VDKDQFFYWHSHPVTKT
jgi:serine/threonine protein kinase